METGIPPSKTHVGQQARKVVPRPEFERIERPRRRGRQFFLLFCIAFLLVVLFLVAG